MKQKLKKKIRNLILSLIIKCKLIIIINQKLRINRRKKNQKMTYYFKKAINLINNIKLKKKK